MSTINFAGLFEALMKEASKPVLTEEEIEEKKNIEAEIVRLTNKLNMLKSRYTELVKKETEGQRQVNKALSQMANLAKNFGLDPTQFGLSKPATTTTQIKSSSSKAKISKIEVFAFDEKSGAWKPHSANSLSEIAWYFTQKCGGSGTDGRWNAADISAALKTAGIDTSHDWEYTFPNGRKIRVVVHGDATPIVAGTIQKEA